MHAARRYGTTINFTGDTRHNENAILEALVCTLAEYYHAFSNYERSIAGIWVCDSLRSGYVRYYTPIKESAKVDGTWDSTDKHFAILEDGRNVTFSKPLRYISELPTNVLLRIADLANECEKPVEIALSYGKPQPIPEDRSFSGNMHINPFLQEKSPAYYFNNARFSVTLNVGLEGKTAWNKQFRPLIDWVKRYLPYNGLGTPLPFRHITIIIDFVDRNHWLRSWSRDAVFNISILELIRLFVHIHQDSIEIVFKTPWSTFSLSLKDLRHRALVYLTQAFGLDYTGSHYAKLECPRIQLDGYGALRNAYPRSYDPSKFPGKRSYGLDRLNELLHLFQGFDDVEESGRQLGRKHSPVRYDKLRSVNNCMNYLREVLSEPNRVNDIAAMCKLSSLKIK